MYKFLQLLVTLIIAQSAAASDCELTPKVLRIISQNKVHKFQRFLRKNNEYDNQKCRGILLIKSIENKSYSLAFNLINTETDLDLEYKNKTALLLAIKHDNINLVMSLLNAGTNPNQLVTTFNGRVKLVDYLNTDKDKRYFNILVRYGAEQTLDCSLKNSMMPKCYHSRNKAVLKVALVYYGASMTMKDLNRIEPLLIKRFSQATQKNVEVNVVDKKVIGFKHTMPADYTYKNIKDKKRLQRIWYYDNVGSKIMQEVYEEYKKVTKENLLDELDAVVAITGGQFDGLGFASGRVSVTEYPREIAWNLENGGRVEYINDYQIVDELIHELGHNMFLGHTSTQCSQAGMDLDARNECCAQSPSKNDVLSYCRNRSAVNTNFMHGFESCNIEMIEDLVVPAMLTGGKWKVSPRMSCE